MINEVKVSKKGQITIPKKIREELGIKPGDKIVFESTSTGIVLRKKEDSDIDKLLNEVMGIWEDHPIYKNKTTKEIIEWIRGPDDDTIEK
ncbi:MAG: AbrB/MazE/SpoVT family DNA-binding domain-containing protein [Promethearchaeia archaeon]